LVAPATLDVSDEVVVVVELASALGLVSLVVEVETSDDALALPLLLYKSAYQPPPLRMNPAPPEIWRLAVAW